MLESLLAEIIAGADLIGHGIASDKESDACLIREMRPKRGGYTFFLLSIPDDTACKLAEFDADREDTEDDDPGGGNINDEAQDEDHPMGDADYAIIEAARARCSGSRRRRKREPFIKPVPPDDAGFRAHVEPFSFIKNPSRAPALPDIVILRRDGILRTADGDPIPGWTSAAIPGAGKQEGRL